MVGTILTDNKIQMTVIGAIAIYVMHFSARRKRFPERPLGDEEMFVEALSIRSDQRSPHLNIALDERATPFPIRIEGSIIAPSSSLIDHNRVTTILVEQAQIVKAEVYWS